MSVLKVVLGDCTLHDVTEKSEKCLVPIFKCAGMKPFLVPWSSITSYQVLNDIIAAKFKIALPSYFNPSDAVISGLAFEFIFDRETYTLADKADLNLVRENEIRSVSCNIRFDKVASTKKRISADGNSTDEEGLNAKKSKLNIVASQPHFSFDGLMGAAVSTESMMAVILDPTTRSGLVNVRAYGSADVEKGCTWEIFSSTFPTGLFNCFTVDLPMFPDGNNFLSTFLSDAQGVLGVAVKGSILLVPLGGDQYAPHTIDFFANKFSLPNWKSQEWSHKNYFR